MTNFAVAIGINSYEDSRFLRPLRYAEKDCQDFYEVFSNASISSIQAENIKLIVGDKATTRNVESKLYQHVVKDRGPEDTVIVYFSGHGFLAGDSDRAYLATVDVHINDLLNNPNHGLRMDWLHDEIFMRSSAKHVIVILDCCHSGALTPSVIRASDNELDYLVKGDFFSKGSGRVALVACPHDESSRESEDLRNGIFTHYLLRGLRGEGVESNAGEVTLDSLLSYVKQMTPNEQQPGSYGQSFGRIVLTKPGAKKALDLMQFSGPVSSNLKLTSAVPVHSLKNPLDTYIPLIDRLMDSLQEIDVSSDKYLDNRILEQVRKASEASLVFTVRVERDNYAVTARSDSAKVEGLNSEGLQSALSETISVFSSTIIPEKIYHNVRFQIDFGGGTKNVLIVPVFGADDFKEYIVLFDLDANSQCLDDVYCYVLSALYKATESLTTVRPKLLEAYMLDSIREHFLGNVPIKLYERRFCLFRKRLHEMVVNFEPILYLEPGSLHICGWEALARDATNMRAPEDLFHAAEVWGPRFLTELDLYFMERSVSSYRDALRRSNMQRPHEIQELSVNVYPSSLMRSSYFESVGRVVKENGMTGKVAFEISEKTPLPGDDGNHSFKEQVSLYVTNYKVGFAIDDFGAGYASVERLANLNPSYVKIDREILFLDNSELAIKFVLDMASSGRMNPVKVVVEGFDGSSVLTLGDLYNLGVHCIQGYAIGKASEMLYRVDKDQSRYLEDLLSPSAAVT